MTISLENAKFIAARFVEDLGSKCDDVLQIMDEHTKQTEEGWLFFYNTRDFIETGEMSYALIGNGPIFVKYCGEVSVLPSSSDCNLI
jgi:hypothetical protein